MMRASAERVVTRCIRLVIGTAGAAILSGCLVIPVDYHSAGSRHNVNANVQSQLQPGVTTKEEVLLLLGEPDYASEDGQCIGYAWRKVKALVFVTAGPTSAATGEVERSYLLHISFDPNSQVSRVELLKKWGKQMPPEPTLPFQPVSGPELRDTSQRSP
jgi:hypothetical protein